MIPFALCTLRRGDVIHDVDEEGHTCVILVLDSHRASTPRRHRVDWLMSSPSLGVVIGHDVLDREDPLVSPEASFVRRGAS